jgi:hypothetical protein
MSRTVLTTTLLLFMLAMGVVNVGIHLMARHSPAHLKVSQLEASSGVACIGVGNSLMDSGFRAGDFAREAARRGHECPSINAALGATYPVEHLMLLLHTLHHGANPRVVIYGFYGFQLTDTPQLRVADLMGNRSIGLYLDRDTAREFYVWPLSSRLAFEVLGELPMFVERGNAYRRVELLRRSIHHWGQDTTNPEPAVLDAFTALEADSEAAFIERCLRETKSQASLSQPILRMLKEARLHGSRIPFILMPMPSRHRERFYHHPEWAAYIGHVTRLLAHEGAELVDASRWMDDASFVDALHMNPNGAAAFSVRLAQELY